MSGRRTLASLVLAIAALALAGGCTKQTVVPYEPTSLERDTFVYKPIEPTPPVAAARRVEPRPAPPPPVIPPPPPCEPDHDAAWEPNGVERSWRWIVIHHSASDTGSAAAFDAWHRNGRHWDELGYHFVIGNGGGSGNGAVEVGSRWPKQKWGAHCRVGDCEEYNYFGIGICLVGNFDKCRPSERQMASLARLVEYLADRYHIDEAHIIGHGQVGDTRCPGRCFPMKDLVARVHQLRAAGQDVVTAE